MKTERGLSSAKLAARARYRRAVEAAIWGMPIVSFAAMRQAYFRDAGARYNDVVYWSKPADWRHQVVGANSTTLHAGFFVNLMGGPVVVRVPRSVNTELFGSVVDAWNAPLAVIGRKGADHGEGAHYALLPPRDVPAPKGCIVIRSETYNCYCAIRLLPRSSRPEDVAKSVACLAQLRIYRSAGDVVSPRFIDMSGRQFDATMPQDSEFYALLARMVLEEPIKRTDLSYMGQLRTLGIGKTAVFSADAPMKRLLEAAIVEAHANVLQGFQAAGSPWWPERRWKSMLDAELLEADESCQREDRVLIDQRAQRVYAVVGEDCREPGNLCLKAFEDSEGRSLSGTHVYRLRIPARPPTSEFWSVTAYDCDSGAFIRKAPVVGIDSLDERLVWNADGSIDVDLSPLPLPGREANWIATAVNRPFFVLFRSYSAEPGAPERASRWALSDIERIDIGQPFRP
jgi:hypothetical protein